MPSPETSINPVVDLGFDENDLMDLLERTHPTDLPIVPGCHRQQIVHLPGRDDLLLRWTTRMGDHFPQFGGQVELTTHLRTYERLLGRLATYDSIYIPAHRSFALAACPQLQSRVIYTVVERLDAKPLGASDNYGLITDVGRALADDSSELPPYIWDHAKIGQYGELPDGQRAALLDLDTFLTHDPRSAYGDLGYWGSLARPYDNGGLQKHIRNLRTVAERSYADRFGWDIDEGGKYIARAVG